MKRKIIILFAIAAMTAFLLAGCYAPRELQLGANDSVTQITISNHLTHTETDTGTAGREIHTHHFVDENGVEFTVTLTTPSTFTRVVGARVNVRPYSNYALLLFNAQRGNAERALQSNFPITSLFSDRASSYTIEVSSYSDLERLAPIIEKGLNSVDPFPISGHKYTFGGIVGDIEFDLPSISVISSGGHKIASFEFYPDLLDRASQPEILYRMQEQYVSLVRRRSIEEDLPTNVWSLFPATSIGNLHFNGEKIDLTHVNFLLDKELDDYILYINNFIRLLTEIAIQTGEHHSVDTSSLSTWSIGGDVWVAAYAEVSQDLFNLDSLTKNEENVLQDTYTLVEIGQLLNLEIQVIHDVLSYIHFITPQTQPPEEDINENINTERGH